MGPPGRALAGAHDFAALNPQAASFVPQLGTGPQGVERPVQQQQQQQQQQLGGGRQSDARPVQQRRRRTRGRPPPQEQAAASRTHPADWESHAEEDWRLLPQQPTQSGRRRGRRRQAVDDDAWTVVPSEAGATEDWSTPSVGTTPWVSVAASEVNDLAVDAMADDAAIGTTTAEVVCTVCVEPIVLPGKLNGATDPAVCMRGCAHVFHRGCLIRWLSTHPSCPNCRTPAAPATVVRLKPLSAASLAQLASGDCGGAGAPEGPVGFMRQGRGGPAEAAAAAAAEAAAEARRTWEAYGGSFDGGGGSFDFDDGGSVASAAPSFRSVTTARGWPQARGGAPTGLAPQPPPGSAPPCGAPPLSYASALLSPTAEADAAAALAAAAAVAAAATVSCRMLSLAPRRQAHAQARTIAAAAGGVSVVQGRVMLAPRQNRRLRAGAGGGWRGAAGLQRVEEELCEGYEIENES